jgi:hypothetical protein
MKDGVGTKRFDRSQVFVIIGKRNRFSLSQLLLILLHQVFVHGDFSGGQGGGSNEFQSGIANKLAAKPKEGLFEVIVGLCGNLKVLKILFAVECDSASLHFALLHINLVTTQHDGDVLADAFEVAMPIGDILVGDSRGDVKHDDTALTLDVITIPETTKLLLTGSVPNVEADVAEICGELQGVNLNTQSSDVLLFEFTSQVALDKSCFACTTIADYKDRQKIVRKERINGTSMEETRDWTLSEDVVKVEKTTHRERA